jgi:hypothetical protein
MKKNDLGIIIAVAVFAGIFSLVLSSFIFTPKSTKDLKAQKIDSIESAFQQPDKRYFNGESINPTQIIQIGDSPNTQPF